jgi:hypothetical protein
MDYPLDVLDQVYRANVIAPLALIQTACHDLKPGARIINVTSDAVSSLTPVGGYGSTKPRWTKPRPSWPPKNSLAARLLGGSGDMRTQMHQEAYPGKIGDRPLPEVSVPGLSSCSKVTCLADAIRLARWPQSPGERDPSSTAI